MKQPTGLGLNFEYACIHGTYWMYYGIVSGFASVFLLAKGYSNWGIGLVLAVANVLAVVLQPLAADIADRAKRVSLMGITEIMTVMMMVTAAGLFAFRGKSLALSTMFVLLLAWHTVLQPLVNSLAFKLEQSGVPINFGATRSMGSLAYSILMAFMGTLVEKHGTGVLPVAGEIVLLMLLVSLFFTKRSYDKSRARFAKEARAAAAHGREKEMKPREASASGGTETVGAETINLLQFARRNRLFLILNLGVVGLYFSNSVLNNYMMQIVSAVGGGSEDMGRILALMAFLEIPTMLFFNRLRRRFSCAGMLKAAAIGFTLKIALCWLAKSVAMIFAAQFFQLVSFALFLPAMVHFISETMRPGEAVKGQALFTTMVTVTTVISSLAGGAILDVGGAGMLTFTATLVTAAGAGIVIAAVDRV